MTATVHQLPGAWPGPPTDPEPLNLSPAEVQQAAGGYVRPADQLRELHARGFTRAYRSKVSGKVVLERAHYDAVTRGQYGAPGAANEAAGPAAAPTPDRAALVALLGTGTRRK